MFRTRVTIQEVASGLRRICSLFVQRLGHGYVTLVLIVEYEYFCSLTVFVMLLTEEKREDQREIERTAEPDSQWNQSKLSLIG